MLALFAATVPAQAQDADTYVAARTAEAAGDAEAAAAGYARLLDESPDDVVIAGRAYRQALRVGDIALALRAAKVLDGSDVAPADIAVLRYAVAVRAGDRTGAAAALEAMKSGPFDFLVPILQAWTVLEGGGDPFTVLDAPLGNALARRYAVEHRVYLQIAMGRVDEAIAGLSLLGGSEYHQDMVIDSAMLLAAKGYRKEARAMLVGDRPEIVRLRKGLERPGPGGLRFGASRLFLRLAADLANEDTVPISVMLSQVVLILDPGEDRARLYLAGALTRGDSHELALRTLDSIDRDSPLAEAAANGRLLILQRSGRTEEALSQARSLATSRRATSTDIAAYAGLLAEDGQHDAAAKAYGDAIARAGDAADWQLLLAQGTAYLKAGRPAQALAPLQRASGLTPDEPQVLTELAKAHAAQGDLGEAQTLLERANRLRPGQAEIIDALGYVYLRRGDAMRALPLLERAVKEAPGDSAMNEHLGDAYWTLRRHFEARYAWRAATVYAEGADAARLDAKIRGGLDRKPN